MKKKIFSVFFALVLVCSFSLVMAAPAGTQTDPATEVWVVKVKPIPVPWQEWRVWEDEQGAVIGVIDDIFFDPPDITQNVAIVRDYVVLDEEIELDDLTWEGTMGLSWESIDDPTDPYILAVNEHVEYFIETTELDRAVLVRYSVAWETSQDIIEAHFINEAILESKSPQAIIGWLSNFDVHNDYHEPIDNFELEFYGKVVPADVLYVYDPPGPPVLMPGWLGPTWYGGWGTPPKITPLPGGIEIEWIDPTRPVPTCEWIHFGVALNPDTVFLTGVKAYLTQLVYEEEECEIDIKPGSDPNSINLKSKGVVPVAVLTTNDFDASIVDPETVVFAGASPVRWNMEDVDSDGDMDMLFFFKTQDLDLTEDSTEATLTGETDIGQPIEGTDTVNIVPKGKK